MFQTVAVPPAEGVNVNLTEPDKGASGKVYATCNVVAPVVFEAGNVNVGSCVVPTIIVIVLVSIHPLLLVNVITVVPGIKPKTSPVELTVAIEVFEETHAFEVAGAVVTVNKDVSPAPTVVVPEITGKGFVATFILALGPSQPFALTWLT